MQVRIYETFLDQLDDMGYSVIRASDENEALACIESNPLCLILSPAMVNSDGTNGVLSRIQGISPKPTIICVHSESVNSNSI